jgi:HEAT repeat protein
VLEDAGPDTGDATSTQASERIQILSNSLRSDSDAEVRRVAAWGLSRYARHAVAAEALADAVLSEKNPDVREMVTWALSWSRTPAAMTALAFALRDEDPRVRRTAAWATGRVRSRASVEGLIGHLSDADASVREVTAWAIGSCSPPVAPAALVRGLGDTERDVRLATVWALCAIADPRTIDVIEAAFAREKDPEVRRGLVRALCAMGGCSIPTLARLMDSSDPVIRAAAVATVVGRKVTKVWPWLRPQLRPSP